MGSEQSSSHRSSQQQTPSVSQAEMKRLLEHQRKQYEKKCQEMMDKAAAQNSPEPAPTVASPVERDRTPYNYTRNDLQNVIRESNTPRPLYPNLNSPGPCSAPFVQNNHYQNNNNPFLPRDDFVFVNNSGPSYDQRFRPSPSAPPPPSTPPAPMTTSTPPIRNMPNRPRSVSRPRYGSRDRGATNERDVLDCPTCHSRYGMNIFQCNNGHSSCSDCKERGRDCGICWQGLTNRRNYELENMVSQIKIACAHKDDGCKLFIKMADMQTHIKECPFKEQQCPLALVFGNCNWRGKLNQISSHFDNMHPTARQTDVDSEIQLTNIINNSQQVHLVLLGVYNFLLHVKVSETDRKIYIAVQLIGTKMSAAKWLYEVHVFNKSESRRKYMFNDICSSASENVNDIFKDGNCAVLPTSYATTFINNGALSYKFFIKKANDGKREFVRNQRGGRGRN